MIRCAQADLFAVIGNPVKHSLSPAMMNAAFKSLGVAGVYMALEVDAPEEDLTTLSKMGFRGLSVTLPHKETAYRLAAEVDETARAIGAVNTLRRAGDGWEGINTDWLGAVRALSDVVPLAGRSALVIGAGGVARAVVYGLEREGAAVAVSNRSAERGKVLAGAFGCDFIPLDELGKSRDGAGFDVVVQCTSVGLQGTGSAPLVPHDFFHPGMVVMDTVYRPLWTPFLRAAKGAGCAVVTGIEMLLHQGVAQLEWWLGRAVPRVGGVDVMKGALISALGHEQDQ